VRGAISVPANRADAIREATSRLLRAMIVANALTPQRIVSAIFTATPDLTADFPAHSARLLGWTDVPLLGATEMAVPGAPKRLVRVLLTVSGVREGTRLTPVYMDGAAALRPDLAKMPVRAKRTHTRHIAIIGLGQIGGSLGLALARAGGWQRVGYDRDRSATKAALAGGAIDVAARSLAAACRRAELVVVAVPVDATPAVVRAAAAAMTRGAVLADTGSARAGITPALEAAQALGVRACGAHPLAGNEGSGYASASAGLFENAHFALLPVRSAVPPLVSQLVRDVGARALRVSAAAHDHALARTSHLPWVVSRAIAANGANAHARGLSGPGFASMTRLAKSAPRMAGAYARANAREVAAAWKTLRDSIEHEVAQLGAAEKSATKKRARPRKAAAPARRVSPPSTPRTRRATGDASRPSRSRRGSAAKAASGSRAGRYTPARARAAAPNRRRDA
jgi:prephenate dehydrogenase